MLSQMRLLHVFCSQTDNIRMFNKYSQNVFIESCRSFYTTFYCLYYFLDTTQKKHFLSFELHRPTIICIVKYLVPSGSSAREMFVLNNISNCKALMRKSIFAVTTSLTNFKNATICTIQRSLGYQRHFFGKSGQTSSTSRARLF